MAAEKIKNTELISKAKRTTSPPASGTRRLARILAAPALLAAAPREHSDGQRARPAAEVREFIADGVRRVGGVEDLLRACPAAFRRAAGVLARVAAVCETTPTARAGQSRVNRKWRSIQRDE